mgnify:CR=1 FL=1
MADQQLREIGLNPDVPTDLHIAGGVHNAMVDLRQIRLEHLDIDTGVGSLHLQLPDTVPYTASIDGGIGRMLIELPEDVEASIYVRGGLGSIVVDPRFHRVGYRYASEGYAEGVPAAELTVEGGIGSIVIR